MGEVQPQGIRVLIVEDDEGIRAALEESLAEEGYEVHGVADGARIHDLAANFRPDLAVLDVRLPKPLDGYEIGRHLRGVSDLPILFLTAADGLDDRLAGFDAGGDDYLVKPFSMAELLVRVRALLRRAGRLSSPVRRVGDLVLDDFARTVRRGEAAIDLTRLEYDLLSTLSRHPGRIFSKLQLLNQVWGYDSYAVNVVEVHVSSLRRKLEAHGPRLIHTVHGVGYVFRP